MGLKKAGKVVGTPKGQQCQRDVVISGAQGIGSVSEGHSCGDFKKQCKMCGVLQGKEPHPPLLPSSFSVLPLLGQINLKAKDRESIGYKLASWNRTEDKGLKSAVEGKDQGRN